MTERKLKLVDWLDDLCVRFIVNLPQEELESVERICFQVEEAQWFYEDFIRPLDPTLPSMNLRRFCLLLFQHCPLLSGFSADDHLAAYSEFLAYKTRVPVRGAIMLNEAMDEVVLVKGWKKGARWSFPRGKINKDEPDLDCAIREVYEETGFDLKEAGLVAEEPKSKYIEVSMREQHMRLYVFRGVPMDTYFEPRTRKEISKIQWYKLSDLPTLKKNRQQQQQDGNGEDLLKDNMFYMVAPFLGPLKHWIREQHKLDKRRGNNRNLKVPQAIVETDVDDGETADEGVPRAGHMAVDEEHVPLPKSDGHLERLFAQLRTPPNVPEASTLPEVTHQSGPDPSRAADPAEELKRLLSVGSGGLAIPSTGSLEPVNPLLSLLKGGSGMQLRQGISTELPPQTPLEQIEISPQKPLTPHHHHVRAPPPFAGMQPPPPFGFPPGHQPHHQPQMVPPPFRHPPMFNSHGFQPPQPPFPQAFIGYQEPGVAHHFQRQQPHNVQPQDQPRRGPQSRPYQQTGDPHFSDTEHRSGINPHVIPPPSTLPAPRLGRASKQTAPRHGPDQTQVRAAAEIYTSLRSNQPPSAAGAPPSGSLGNVLPALQKQPTPGATNAQLHTSGLPGRVESPLAPIAPKPRNAHQESLLSLFRSPSVSAATPNPVVDAGDEPTEPIELCAQPSPGVPRRPSQGYQSNRPPSSVPQNLQAGFVQKPLTSATVSGPLNVPDFETVQRQVRPAEVNGGATASTKLDDRSAQLIALFTKAGAQSADGLTNSNTTPISGVSPLVNIQESKPLNPQVARHTQPSATTAASQQPQAFDRRHILPTDQKRDLLALFAKPAAPAPTSHPTSAPIPIQAPAKANTPIINSPVSPIPEKASAYESPALEPARSRISSIGSLGGSDIPMRQGTLTIPSGNSANGPQTPVSSADKSFLLGYLKAVAKGERQ